MIVRHDRFPRGAPDGVVVFPFYGQGAQFALGELRRVPFVLELVLRLRRRGRRIDEWPQTLAAITGAVQRTLFQKFILHQRILHQNDHRQKRTNGDDCGSIHKYIHCFRLFF